MKVESLSHVRFFAAPWTVAHQAPPFMGFSSQEYWSGLPFPSPGDLPDPGIEQVSSIVGRRFNLRATSEAQLKDKDLINAMECQVSDSPHPSLSLTQVRGNVCCLNVIVLILSFSFFFIGLKGVMSPTESAFKTY